MSRLSCTLEYAAINGRRPLETVLVAHPFRQGRPALSKDWRRIHCFGHCALKEARRSSLSQQLGGNQNKHHVRSIHSSVYVHSPIPARTAHNSAPRCAVFRADPILQALPRLLLLWRVQQACACLSWTHVVMPMQPRLHTAAYWQVWIRPGWIM